MDKIIIEKDSATNFFVAHYDKQYSGICGVGDTATDAVEMLKLMITQYNTVQLFGD